MSPARPPYLLVVNRTARSGAAAARVEAALEALADAGVRALRMETSPGGGTVDAVAERLREGAWAGVLAMGGDGTFHEVANGLLQSGRTLPFGLLPAGTGNNQARSLGIPLDDLRAAATVIAAGRTVPLDGAWVQAWDDFGERVGEAWSFDSVGFGFSARALHFRFEDKARVEQLPVLKDVWRDELVYAGATARALLGAYVEDHRFDAEVRSEDGTTLYEDLHDLIVNNTRTYARAWVLDPTGAHDDGLFELLPVRGLDDWAAHALFNLDGSPLRDWFDVGLDPALVRGARFDITLFDRPMEPPIPMQVDGEPWPAARRVRVAVRKGALDVLAPDGVGAPPNG